MRRFLHIDWRTWLTFAFAVTIVFVIADRERLAAAREDAIAAETAGQGRERALLEGQRELQSQVDRLVSQNAALVELFRTTGIDVPAGLIAGRGGTVTRIETNDGDDDDDDGDTIIVRPSAAPSRNPPRTTPPPDNDDDDGADIDLPHVPLPDEAGEATDTAKRIVDDLTGIKLD